MRTTLGIIRGGLRGQSGVVEVETAIVLPAVTFILLGLIQMGLLHQARLMAKYAAYRAVRTGALRNVDQTKMEQAGLAAALPILSYNVSNTEVLSSTYDASAWSRKWKKRGFGGHPSNKMTDLANIDEIKYVEIKICGPLRSELEGYTYEAGGTDYVPFDDPDLAGQGIKTKLRIQLTLNYRMIIPFADWVLYHAWRGWKYSRDFHLGEGESRASGSTKYDRASLQNKVYIIPMVAQYAMKLHSDVPLGNLPGENECQ